MFFCSMDGCIPTISSGDEVLLRVFFYTKNDPLSSLFNVLLFIKIRLNNIYLYIDIRIYKKTEK